MGYEFVMRQKPDSDEIITDDYLEHSLEDMLNNNEPKTFYLFNRSSDDRGGSFVSFSPNPLWGVSLVLNFGVLGSFRDKPARLYSFNNPSVYINSIQELKTVIKENFETKRKEAYRRASDKTVKNIYLHATLPDTEAAKAATFVWTTFIDHVAKTKKNTHGNVNANSGKHDIFSHSSLSNSIAMDSNMWAVVPKGEELAHYGVEGMKWGVRRYQNPDGTLTAAGREHYGKGGTKEVKNEGVGAALALYAAITLGPYAVLSAMAAGLSAAEAHKEKKREQKAEAELFGEGKDYGLTMDDVKKVNPHYSEDRNYKINCPKCSTVVELRKRGMNVSANTGSGQTDKEMAAWFKGAKPKENLHVDTAKETILSFPAGSSGFISGKYNYMGGHVVHWTNIGNNTIRIEDGQVGKVYTWDQFKETYHFQIDRYTVTRLDNCKINEKLMKDQAVFVEYKEEKK